MKDNLGSSISENAKIGNNVQLGQFVIIEDGVEIGENSIIGNFCILREGVRLGQHANLKNHIEIGANCSIGEYAEIDSYTLIKERIHIGDNINIGSFSILHEESKFGDDNVIGSYCEIGRGLEVGNNNIIQGRIRTGDFCTIENDVTIKYGTILTSRVLLKSNAFLGPNVITLGSTHQRVTVHGTIIGSFSYIGAGSKIAGGVVVGDNITTGALSYVNKDLIEPGIYVGVPTKKIK